MIFVFGQKAAAATRAAAGEGARFSGADPGKRKGVFCKSEGEKLPDPLSFCIETPVSLRITPFSSSIHYITVTAEMQEETFIFLGFSARKKRRKRISASGAFVSTSKTTQKRMLKAGMPVFIIPLLEVLPRL